MYDVIVIGAGAAGLVIAIGATKAKKKVLLIEKRFFGGDCTNFGCIPSKSLIASAKTAHAIKNAHELGIQTGSISIDGKGAFSRVRQIIKTIRTYEEPLALEALGVETLVGTASFKDPHTLLVNEREVKGKQIVIATGSYPIIPPIEGLKETPFLTNETIFNLEEIPAKMIFIGGGPIGCELSQALSRLGSDVTIVERKILAREDEEARQVLITSLQKEGISLKLGSYVEKVTYENNQFTVFIEGQSLQAGHLFVGVGRRPHLQELELDKAKLDWSENGVIVNPYGSTTQPHIWAVGDAIGPPFFTHFAENQARTVLKNLLIPFKTKKSSQALPRVTYTDPEIASIGMISSTAIDKYGEKKLAIYTVPFSEVDRNITNGRTEGFVKIITKKWSSQILGATIVGPRAGEMLMEISLAMFTKTPLRKLSQLIHPYPIESLSIRKAADLWLTQILLGVFRKKS